MRSILDRAPTPQLVGQAGVWAVAAQLAVRGLHVHFPGVDYGYDLMVDGGIRIQVKTSRLLSRASRKNGPDGYSFKFWSAARSNRGAQKRDYSKVCHFVVLWGIDENRFWIAPAELVANTAGVLLGPPGFYQRKEFADTKALFKAGVSKNEIAARLGITVQAVDYHLRGGRTRQPRRTVGMEMRELEGRWDLITGALATLHDANAAIMERQPETDPVASGV